MTNGVPQREEGCLPGKDDFAYFFCFLIGQLGLVLGGSSFGPFWVQIGDLHGLTGTGSLYGDFAARERKAWFWDFESGRE